MTCGIYAWKLDGVYKYVGYGKNVEDRMFDSHYQNSYIKKYDYNEFEKMIICYCEIDEMRKLESYYIKKLQTHISEGGFNCNYGGGGCTEQTLKSKQKISNATSGENNPFYGKHHTEKFKEKIKNNHPDFSGENHPLFGKTPSIETRKKMSDGKINRFEEDAPRFGTKAYNSTSKYYGVVLHKIGKYIYWRAQLNNKKKRVRLGISKLEIEAARMYDEYVIKNNLPNPLNFPEDYK